MNESKVSPFDMCELQKVVGFSCVLKCLSSQKCFCVFTQAKVKLMFSCHVGPSALLQEAKESLRLVLNA